MALETIACRAHAWRTYSFWQAVRDLPKTIGFINQL
jgi:hypothetical protein